MMSTVRKKFHLREQVNPRRHRKGVTAKTIADSWNECCQSFEQHRPDCTEDPSRGGRPL